MRRDVQRCTSKTQICTPFAGREKNKNVGLTDENLLAVVSLFCPCVCPLFGTIVACEQMFMHTGITIWMDGSTEQTGDNTQPGVYFYLN